MRKRHSTTPSTLPRWLEILLALGAAALLSLFSFNIFNPVPGLFIFIGEVMRPFGEMMPGGFEFIPLLGFLLLMNLFLARVIMTYTKRRWRLFSLVFWRASLCTTAVGTAYVLMVMWALSRLQ